MSGGVPPSSRARSRQFRAKRGEIAKAANLYERFTGHDAEKLMTVKVPQIPSAVAVIGECDGVLYTTVRDGVKEKYIHEFASGDKPLLCVAPDGHPLLLIGGGYRFTSLGVVDDSDKKHRNVK